MERPERILIVLIMCFSSLCSTRLTNLPFSSIWNAPTERCRSRFGVTLDLSVFDIVYNHNDTFMGDNVTIFYSDRLGEYPHYETHGEPVYGGVPQNASLNRHLLRARRDIQADIPDLEFNGLAVIDWEEWRPLWERNWDTKYIYWKGSRALVKARHPFWSPDQIEREAVKEFEAASRGFMEETLKLGSRERPGGLWGFYGFPCCYNYQYKKNETYTGECPALEIKRNDRLVWLWNASAALYPDIYLELGLRGRGGDILLYSRHRVLEALRVKERTSRCFSAIFPYARIAYTYSLEFLSQEDLVHTIGESVALGASGVVLWGDGSYSQTKEACEAVRDYLDNTLGRYILNLTEAAALCSRKVCSAQGRCVRRDSSGRAFLHLNSDDWDIVPRKKQTGLAFEARRRKWPKGEKRRLMQDFQCQCFPGWSGEQCQKPVPRTC